MHALSLVLAFLAYAAFGRRVQGRAYDEHVLSNQAKDVESSSHLADSRTSSLPSTLESLRQLLIAVEPAGRQMSDALNVRSNTPGFVHSRLGCSSLQQGRFAARCQAPVLESVFDNKGIRKVFKSNFPKSRVVKAKELEKKAKKLKGKRFQGGTLEEAMEYMAMEAKYGKARYLAPDDPERAVVDPQGYWDAMKTKEKAKLREDSNLQFQATQSQLLQDHAFLTVIFSAFVWSFFSLRVFRSYLVGAAAGLFFLYLLGKSASNFGATAFEQTERAPPPVIAPIVMTLIVAKQKEYLDVLPAIIGFTSYLFTTVYQVAYPPDFGVPPADEEAASPTVAEA
mmetsp:Transcript_8262/g.14258  ORF Transcript_8262/g.14258 Transcript_8262/m.14258 type:complete len:339 (+) Transcript_8262:86-1102(+)